jgi:hypothetical protein
MFLVDADVLSALAKRRRHANVEAWIGRQRSSDLFVSVISIGEIERGIASQRAKDPNFAAMLATWLDQLLIVYVDRVLAFELLLQSLTLAQVHPGRPPPYGGGARDDRHADVRRRPALDDVAGRVGVKPMEHDQSPSAKMSRSTGGRFIGRSAMKSSGISMVFIRSKKSAQARAPGFADRTTSPVRSSRLTKTSSPSKRNSAGSRTA